MTTGSTTDLAWAAGLFEGEGCFSTSGTRGARAMLGMNDLATVERFRDVVGFGNIYENKRPDRNTLWMWTASSFETFQATVALLWQWLSPRRRARATELMLRAAPARVLPTHCKRSHPYDEENTYIDRSRGHRVCRACLRINYRNRKARMQ